MKELAQLLFSGQKIILNDPSDQPQDEEESKVQDFVSQVKEEAQRYDDAAQQVIDHFEYEIQQAKDYSKLLQNQK